MNIFLMCMYFWRYLIAITWFSANLCGDVICVIDLCTVPSSFLLWFEKLASRNAMSAFDVCIHCTAVCRTPGGVIVFENQEGP
jgi:hypothetical protein